MTWPNEELNCIDHCLKGYFLSEMRPKLKRAKKLTTCTYGIDVNVLQNTTIIINWPFPLMSLALLLGMRAMKSNVVLLSRNASSNTASIPPLLYSCVNIKRKLPLTFPDNALHDDKNIGTGSSSLYKRVTRELFDILVLSALSLSWRVGGFRPRERLQWIP